MNSKPVNAFKLIVAALVVFCSVLMYQLFQNSSSNEEFVKKSKLENKALQNQIDEILGKYDSLKAITDANAYSRLPIGEDLPRSFENEYNDDVEKISFLKSTIKNDKEEVVFLTNRIATHSNQLKKLAATDNKTVAKKMQYLSAINVNAKGVKILSDLYTSTPEKTIQQMRVCFTLEGNEFISKGDKKVYIQVVNPKNQIISANNSSLEAEETVLIYSEEVTAFYNQKDTDVCTYVNLEKNKTVKGKYLVNIYANFKKIGTTTFEYN